MLKQLMIMVFDEGITTMIDAILQKKPSPIWNDQHTRSHIMKRTSPNADMYVSECDRTNNIWSPMRTW